MPWSYGPVAMNVSALAGGRGAPCDRLERRQPAVVLPRTNGLDLGSTTEPQHTQSGNAPACTKTRQNAKGWARPLWSPWPGRLRTDPIYLRKWQCVTDKHTRITQNHRGRCAALADCWRHKKDKNDTWSPWLFSLRRYGQKEGQRYGNRRARGQHTHPALVLVTACPRVFASVPPLPPPQVAMLGVTQ